MNAAQVLVEREDDVLRVTVNRPEKRNALSRPVLERLRCAFRDHAGDETLRLAVLTGAGDRSFAAGGDLRDLASVRSHGEAEEMARGAKAALDAVREFPVPVVARLNGDAMGGGAELALACDFRVAAAHARIGFVQGRLNVSTAWGGGIDLMHRIGTSQALGVLCRSEMLDPRSAVGIGMVDRVAEGDEDLDVALEDFVRPVLRQAPQVLRAFKALAVASRAGASREVLYAVETARFAGTWVHEDHWAAADRVLDKSPDRLKGTR